MKHKELNTVYDVARAAGVSVATVSRVLNQFPNVSNETRERVLAVIRESGFRPNASARRLVKGRSGQICFLLCNRDVVHSFHSRILKGVEDYSQQKHHHVIFTSFNYESGGALSVDDLPRIIREDSGLEGLLIAGTNYPALLKYIDSLKVPYVLFGNNLVTGSLRIPRRNSVSFDEQRGAEEATGFLVELGHRHVTFVGDLSKVWYQRRFEGYRSAMAARKLPIACVDLKGGSDCYRLGQRALPVLIRRWPKTTAVLAQDDETACGVLDGLRKLGIRVPDEISLIGYDDIAEIQYLSPALTTVRVPKEEIGWTMADQLFRMTEGLPTSAPLLATELVIRDSCTRPVHPD